jgi:catechol 2,3-dioxygenase-like lactoylglutathione lyase family enzyme
MPLHYLEHFLIQTVDLDKTVRWWIDVVGMTAGHTPDFKFPVQWMYIGERDVLHLTAGGANVSANRMAYLGQQSTATDGTGVIDHVAFRATDLAGMLKRLRAHKVEFNQRMVNDQGLFQVFFFDPNGVKVELNFDNAEAVALGIDPDIKASDLPIAGGVVSASVRAD